MADVRLRSICAGREIHMLVSDPASVEQQVSQNDGIFSNFNNQITKVL